jgi:hypothetical protein
MRQKAKILREKQTTETRYKCLADVSKREFDVVASKKRTLAWESSILGVSNEYGQCGFSLRSKNRYGDDNADNDEVFPMPKDEPMQDMEVIEEDVMEAHTPAKSTSNRLKRPRIRQFSDRRRSIPVKKELQIANSNLANSPRRSVKPEPIEGPVSDSDS